MPDLLRRDFTASTPNTKYVGAVTYLPADDDEFPYLATAIDRFSRPLAGRPITDHTRTELVTDALRAATRTPSSPTGAVFHSDHGTQLRFNQSLQHP
ncbi:DDE-type integrase/transposase/recombinase [Streptomyces glaucus]|uniref:Integrase catalytic domain-containing protein n=1 Tax=Streptomyces glaucus TaxID=284029 RepID=A0ABP5WEB0_9ACTN